MNSHRNTQYIAFRLAVVAAAAMIITACSTPSITVPESAATPTVGSTDAGAAQSAPAGVISNDLINNFPSPVLASPLSSPVARDLPAALPIPTGGNATVTGVLVDARTGAPMANTTVRFALTRDNSFVVDTTNSPSTVSDAIGRFTMANLKADTYILVVGDPYTIYTFAPDLDKPTEIRVFDFKADKINNVDVLIVDYEAIKPQQ
jgi:hypothetical protein